MKLKNLALAALLAVGSVPAFAVSTVVENWHAHDATEIDFSSFKPDSSFDRILKFNIVSGTFAALAVAVTNDYASVFNITGAKVELFKNIGGKKNYSDDTSLGSFLFDSAAFGTIFASLGKGDYYYRVTGSVVGTSGGSYTLSSTLAAPVPEPGTLALVMAGLGVVGLVARRRRPE